ncbi:MAG: rhomboid family intramembrane serine protease [Alphaproteobacteria bacterium]|nr:rhomboid family intramembrane serine protease [Alphaproteobacteria bacterium]
MRKIGTVEQQAQAKVLSDVLVARGMANDLRPDDAGWAVWVHDDARLDEARTVLADFHARPDDPAFAEEAGQGRGVRLDRRRKDEAYRRRVRLAQESLHGVDGRGWLTLSLLVLSAVVTAASGMGADWSSVSLLFLTVQPASEMLPEVRAGQVWRLVTPIFVHGGVLHLLFNGWMWWSFAQRIENRKGFRFFGVFVLAAAVGSNLAEWAWQLASNPHGLVIFGGMSGVLYAVFGYAWWKGRIDPADQLQVPQQTVQILIGWLLLCMVGVIGDIANAAHLGGLLFGVAWAYVDVAWFRWRKGR